MQTYEFLTAASVKAGGYYFWRQNWRVNQRLLNWLMTLFFDNSLFLGYNIYKKEKGNVQCAVVKGAIDMETKENKGKRLLTKKELEYVTGGTNKDAVWAGNTQDMRSVTLGLKGTDGSLLTVTNGLNKWPGKYIILEYIQERIKVQFAVVKGAIDMEAKENNEKRLLTKKELEKVTGGMRQTGSALSELLNRENLIPDDIMNNIMNNNVIGGSEGYSRQKVNPAAIGQHVSLW